MMTHKGTLTEFNFDGSTPVDLEVNGSPGICEVFNERNEPVFPFGFKINLHTEASKTGIRVDLGWNTLTHKGCQHHSHPPGRYKLKLSPA